MPIPKLKLLPTTLCLLASVLANSPQLLGAEPIQDEVIHLDHGKVDNAFAKGGPLVINSRYKVQAGRRVTSGTVEIHEHDTDIFYVLEGSATFLTGGSAVEQTLVGPGEFHAKGINGGITQHLAKGDIIIIPNGVPHQFTEVSGTFLYYVVKVTK